jgi:penicillin-binding protein 2
MKRISVLLLVVVFLLACGETLPNVRPLNTLPTDIPPPPPTPAPTPTPLPSPRAAAERFLTLWEKGGYGDMYDQLSSLSRGTWAVEAFTKRYLDIASVGTFTAIKTQILDIDQALNRATVNFSVSIDTTLAGQFNRRNRLTMIFEDGDWRIEWTPTVIFSELSPGNRVYMIVHDNPRANIYDRNNQKLTDNELLVNVGVVPGDIADEGRLLFVLSSILEMDAKAIKSKIVNAKPEWLVPLKSIPAERANRFKNDLLSFKAVQLRDTARRVYPFSATAEHLVGYVGAISENELLQLAPKGYSPDDLIGKAGLEKWGEPYLRGDLGGTLVIINPDGQIVTTLAARGAQMSRNVHTTIDMDMQGFIENELANTKQPSAAVLLDVRTGEILAMASYPGYDLETLMRGTPTQVQALLRNSQRPLINRATQGVYPTGSVFKIVTISAGLERGGFSPDSVFNCTGTWTYKDITKKDWWPTGHGRITLYNGLIQSCNIVFYDVGLKLDQIDRSILPTYARAYGFGVPTQAPGLSDEAGGFVPDPTRAPVFVGDMVNAAIGQGDFQASPLQVANMLAAVANGGSLYRPRLVAKVAGPNGERPVDFTTQLVGKLPVSPANLATIQRALRGVTSTALGTAAASFAGARYSVAGKTGTAEAPPGAAHAWFAAYAPADNPRVALVVMIEHGGEGSRVAAPIARKILDKYFAR